MRIMKAAVKYDVAGKRKWMVNFEWNRVQTGNRHLRNSRKQSAPMPLRVVAFFCSITCQLLSRELELKASFSKCIAQEKERVVMFMSFALPCIIQGFPGRKDFCHRRNVGHLHQARSSRHYSHILQYRR